MAPEEETLELAIEVVGALEAHGARAAVIGAVALAVHGYPRATEDLDLATAVDLPTLRLVSAALRTKGYSVRLGEPDAEDPLGGVLSIVRDGADPVQVVNYANPYRPGSGALAEDAVSTAMPATLGSLAVVDIAHLIALKLYAGGIKSTLDVAELLARNHAADRDAIGDVCTRFGLAEEWLRVSSSVT